MPRRLPLSVLLARLVLERLTPPQSLRWVLLARWVRGQLSRLPLRQLGLLDR